MGIGDMLKAEQDAEDAARYRWLKAQFELLVEKRESHEQIEETEKRIVYEKRVEYWCTFELKDSWRFGKTQGTDKLDFDKFVDELRAERT